MDYNSFERYLAQTFRPDTELRREHQPFQDWHRGLRKGTTIELQPAIPIFKSVPVGTGTPPPSWLYQNGSTGKDRYPVWFAAAQYHWATSVDDRNVRWDPLLDRFKDEDFASPVDVLLSGQDAVRREVASGAKGRIASLWEWVKNNWQNIKDFFKTDTPFGTIGQLTLLVVKAAAKFVWNGFRWIFHLFADMDDSELQNSPEARALDLCPYAVMDLPRSKIQIPLSMTSAASYSVGAHARFAGIGSGTKG
jgi:hypothetical protein